MKKKWKITLISLLTVAFIGGNLFLLFKESSKADRVSYIKEWTRVQKDDVKETFQTKGVVQPETKHGVYYDEQQGPFSSFLVKEGDVVSAGTGLFTYGSKDLEDEKAEVDAEITQIQGELDGVNEEIAELKKLTTPSSTSGTSSTSGNKDLKVEVNVDVTSGVKTDVEKAILAAETEASKLKAKLEKYESKLSRISDKISQTTVNSEVEGQVVAINKDMQNPIITIASKTLAVEGELTESQMKKVAVEQQVKMHSTLHDQDYEGNVQQIVSYPKGNPSVDKETKYPFMVRLNDADEQLLPGAKLSMQVIVNEVKDVPVVATKSTFKTGKKMNVYQLNEKGFVKKTKITPGLSFAGKQEVTNGVKEGSLIVVKPKLIHANNSAFITPMTTTTIQKYNLKQLSKKQMAKYLLMGVFEN
ncbi:efflux RND transporter periplasmic adaptor subunit [Bacillus massiliigorillae]|uniref:efflux RND transporter periplasmic adaptor subunit n=1 Tax=Bacillus massiliigorillae TaxID=1243664 RepID=UPI0003A7D282|nr:HlyD family efflux transporter periplasmic adaptor subunit [Bacillus massiliigorillae]